MKSMTFAALALALLVSPAARGALKTEAEIDAMLTKFLALLQTDKSGEAFDLLMRQWTPPDKAEVETMRLQVTEGSKLNGTRFGKITGTEKVKSCRVGHFLYKTQAVVKYERGIVFWNLTFYDPGTGWTFDSYRFDNKNFVPLTDACNFP